MEYLDVIPGDGELGTGGNRGVADFEKMATAAKAMTTASERMTTALRDSARLAGKVAGTAEAGDVWGWDRVNDVWSPAKRDRCITFGIGGEGRSGQLSLPAGGMKA